MSTSARANEPDWPSWPADTPLILVTNDDGIDSPGLRAAVESVRGLGTIVIVAPTTQQTSRGRGMSGNWDDHLHPALAVQHAVSTIFHQHWPDLIVSGAADGIPGVAASQDSEIPHHYEYGELDWEGATGVVRKYASQMVDVLRDGRTRVDEDPGLIDEGTDCTADVSAATGFFQGNGH